MLPRVYCLSAHRILIHLVQKSYTAETTGVHHVWPYDYMEIPVRAPAPITVNSASKIYQSHASAMHF